MADALSRLSLSETQFHPPQSVHAMAEVYGLDKEELSPDIFPLRFRHIEEYQSRDKALLRKLASNSVGYTLNSFRGGGKS